LQEGQTGVPRPLPVLISVEFVTEPHFKSLNNEKATPTPNIAMVVIGTTFHFKRELGWSCISFLS
jgi:hypothetical protein